MTGQQARNHQDLASLVGLYQKDPEAFEKERKRLIRETIEEFPEEYRQRAYGMQFQLEARLRKYRDPLVRMNMMVEIFWEQVELFQEVLRDPAGVMREREGSRKPARVVPFRRRKSLS